MIIIISYLSDIVMNVTHHLVTYPGQTHVNDDSSRLDNVGMDQTWYTCSRDHEVGRGQGGVEAGDGGVAVAEAGGHVKPALGRVCPQDDLDWKTNVVRSSNYHCVHTESSGFQIEIKVNN